MNILKNLQDRSHLPLILTYSRNGRNRRVHASSGQVTALQRQAEADARLSEICARLEAGDQRERQMQQEVEGLQQQLEADAKDAASKHAVVEEQLRGSQAALATRGKATATTPVGGKAILLY